MRRGARLLCFAASLAVAGCAAEGELKIRPIADPSAKLRPGADRLADARAQLALGNVGLATEAFRKAVREQPDNVDAYAGLAACYEAMGRYDLARRNYEAALALAPKSPALLDALAVLLDRQGLREEAAQVRAEIADLAAASTVLDADVEPEPPPMAVAWAPAPVTIASGTQMVTVQLPPAGPAPLVAVSLPTPGSGPATMAALPPVKPAASVTVPLPPARPVAAAAEVSLPAPNLAAEARVDVRTVGGPRLERLSLGEVGLFTTNEPQWRPTVISRTAQSTTVRWVPLRTAAKTRPNIRLLNAARSQGLAARTRQVLLGRGWRMIDIGDAAEVRAISVVLYPASRQTLGRSLAAQFGFRSAITDKSEHLVVLLGRDAAGLRAIRARG